MANDLEFSSLGALAVHIRHAEQGLRVGVTRGLRNAASLLLRDVKLMFGDYHTGIGPFPDWAKLSESALKKKKYFSLHEADADAPLVLNGDLRRSYEMRIEGNEAVVGSNNPYALLQELGGEAPHGAHIPGRSTLGIAFMKAEAKLFERYNREAWLMFNGEGGIETILDRSGTVVASNLE